MASIYESLARVILPAGILDVFEVTNVVEHPTRTKDETGTEVRIINIYLDEHDLRGEESGMIYDLMVSQNPAPSMISLFATIKSYCMCVAGDGWTLVVEV